MCLHSHVQRKQFCMRLGFCTGLMIIVNEQGLKCHTMKSPTDIHNAMSVTAYSSSASRPSCMPCGASSTVVPLHAAHTSKKASSAEVREATARTCDRPSLELAPCDCPSLISCDPATAAASVQTQWRPRDRLQAGPGTGLVGPVNPLQHHHLVVDLHAHTLPSAAAGVALHGRFAWTPCQEQQK